MRDLTVVLKTSDRKLKRPLKYSCWDYLISRRNNYVSLAEGKAEPIRFPPFLSASNNAGNKALHLIQSYSTSSLNISGHRRAYCNCHCKLSKIKRALIFQLAPLQLLAKMAEREGLLRLRLALRGFHFNQASLRRLASNPGFSSLLNKVAEREGFEPPEACTSPVFKTGALNHSTISPYIRNCTKDRRHESHAHLSLRKNAECIDYPQSNASINGG